MPVGLKPKLIKCINCQRVFMRTGNRQQYCPDCLSVRRKNWYDRTHQETCPVCGKPKVAHRGQKSSICRQCYDEKRHTKPNRRKVKGGYIKAKNFAHPRADARGYVFEHILVWEKEHNKLLPEKWVIHHLNGIKDDNRPVNLVALPEQKHRLILQAKAKRIQELEALLNNQLQLI